MKIPCTAISLVVLLEEVWSSNGESPMGPRNVSLLKVIKPITITIAADKSITPTVVWTFPKYTQTAPLTMLNINSGIKQSKTSISTTVPPLYKAPQPLKKYFEETCSIIVM
jgi:hypothetical protein